MENTINIDSLPQYCFKRILKFLKVDDLLNLLVLDKFLSEIVTNSQIVWKHRYWEYFPRKVTYSDSVIQHNYFKKIQNWESYFKKQLKHGEELNTLINKDVDLTNFSNDNHMLLLNQILRGSDLVLKGDALYDLNFFSLLFRLLIHQINLIKKPFKAPKILFISHSREICYFQIQNLRKTCKNIYDHSICAVGGTDLRETIIQISKIENIDIILGTPGRIIDLEQRSFLSLQNLEVVILYESDRLSDMGFDDTISDLLENKIKKQEFGRGVQIILTESSCAQKNCFTKFLSKNYLQKLIKL